MLLLINMGQENERGNRNEKPQSDEDGERVADSNLCQRGKQHQYRAEQNDHTPNRGCRSHTCLNHTTFEGQNSGWPFEVPAGSVRADAIVRNMATTEGTRMALGGQNLTVTDRISLPRRHSFFSR